MKDTIVPHTPDSIFPNNWISFHQSGNVVVYPMFAKNRRMERRSDIIQTVADTGFKIAGIIDYSDYENCNCFLEGTGSMVLIYVVKRLIGSFLYGMAASMFGIGAAIFFRDRYMLLCLPFLLNYIYTQILQRLTLENPAVERFNSSNLMNVSGESGWVWTVGLTIVCYVILVLLYYAQVKRRHCDG